MEQKLCKKCNIQKNIEEFRLKKDKNGKYYRYSYCMQCDKQIKKNSYNKEKNKIKSKKYRENNAEKVKAYNDNNRENGYYIKYKLENSEKYKIYNQNYLKKLKCNPIKRLKRQARDAVRNGFRRKGFSKNSNTYKLLGCNYTKFIYHLLQTFEKNYGYKWDGKEKVHIDHIIPLVTAKTEDEIINLSNYKNLQLLKPKDNLKKGIKQNYKIVYSSKEI